MRVAMLLLAITFLLPVFSQHFILLKDGTVLKADVLEVFDTHIGFQSLDKSKDYRLFPKDSIFLVKTKTEDILVFSSDEDLNKPDSYSRTKVNLFDLGLEHAKAYYRSYDEAQYTTFGLTLLSPAVGLVPAIAMSSITPQEDNLGYPNDKLWKSEAYRMGYSMKARKMKSKKVWDKFGLAFGINLVLAAIIYVGVIGEVR